MSSDLQPPFIVDILCYLIIIALIYLVYYSFNLRKEILNSKFDQLLHKAPPVVATKSLPQPQLTNSAGKLHFYIEPSPIPGENVPFPSIYSQPELSLSIVVPVRDMQDTIINTLEQIQIYFSKKQEMSNNNFTYEVIVVDMLSTDNTYSVVYDYALQNHEFRILKIPVDFCLNYSLLISAARIRGKLLFIYIPQENLPVDIYSKLEQKVASAKEDSFQKEIIALSCLLNPDQLANYSISDNVDHNEDQSFYDEHYTPLLSSFIDYLITKMIYLFTNLENKAANHFRSMLLTREAALAIFPNIKMSGDWFNYELIVIASREKMRFKYAMIEPGEYYGSIIDLSSWERIDRFLDLAQSLLLYSTGIWKIYRRRA
ncbi:dolichyl-phosphate beta-glucosyltransferase [Tritrichomonas musculus]|uniref:Dolichyl-phosphate beta-glucosyltransferase n=1 Tax=Tritrichomonas musculus TaxID=1915356 RepID=A0ABR2L247_9EUKA